MIWPIEIKMVWSINLKSIRPKSIFRNPKDPWIRRLLSLRHTKADFWLRQKIQMAILVRRALIRLKIYLTVPTKIMTVRLARPKEKWLMNIWSKTNLIAKAIRIMAEVLKDKGGLKAVCRDKVLASKDIMEIKNIKACKECTADLKAKIFKVVRVVLAECRVVHNTGALKETKWDNNTAVRAVLAECVVDPAVVDLASNFGCCLKIINGL